MANTVEELKEAADAVKDFLIREGEASLVVTAEDVWRKSVLIAAASHFEHELGRAIERCAEVHGVSDTFRSLISAKAISRQFYSYFDFESKNTNRLFNSFGAKCKERADQLLKESAELRDAQRAFLEVCALRNKMVHTNYASFVIEITTDEVFVMYQNGRRFITFFEEIVSGGEGRH